MAMPTAAGTTQGLKPAPLALLPPIPLYRRLFRAHRKFLPKESRVLGDEYIKKEFRQHQNIENPMHIVRLLCHIVYCGRVLLTDKKIDPDWIFDRVADVCPEN